MEVTQEFKDEVKSIGLEFVPSDEIKGPFLHLEVDLDTEVDYSKLVDYGLTMRRRTKRNEYVYVKLQSYQDGTLTLGIIQPCPEEVAKLYGNLKKTIGMTFMDFCWYHSEGTNEITLDEVHTRFREGKATPGNLTWFMPVHACDNLVEVLHVLNQSFLEGVLEESIIYGVRSIE